MEKSTLKSEMQIKRILVAVDGSENARRAVEVASVIAKKNDADLTILHVMNIPSAAFTGDFPFPLYMVEEEAKREGEKFVESASSVARRGEIKAKLEIVEGMDSPVKAIIDYSDKNEIDLIVVGTRGLGSFKRLLLGSVASGLVHYAHCSVLVVRQQS